jgi:hypothetical protein
VAHSAKQAWGCRRRGPAILGSGAGRVPERGAAIRAVNPPIWADTTGLCREAGPEWTWEARARATVARQSIRRSLEANGLLKIRNSRNSSGE